MTSDIISLPEQTLAPAESRYVTKRDGSRELVNPVKLIKWNEWASKLLGSKVPWAQASQEVLNELYDGITTTELQDMLIKWFMELGTWNGNRMAGILWAPMLHKKYFPKGIPTVLEMHKNLQSLGLMRILPYSDEEYAEIETFIDHDRDMNYTHFQLKHITGKYSLVNYRTNKRFETPQFIYMRKAMALSEFISKDKRMTYIRDQYELFSENVVNSPTPNYVHLGTKLNGLVSCCLYTTLDTIPSLATGNAIAFRMTAIGAGIGGFIRSRGLGEEIRGGAISHNGKLPYYKSQAGDVKANMQAARAGACTSYYNIFDAEAMTIAQLQNPRTPANRQNRDMHFAVQYHSLFLKKALLDEDIFTFSCKSAPDLFDAFYSGDKNAFETLYNKYDQDDTFIKNYVSARELMVVVCRQSPDVGTHYEFYTDNANKQTPFKETIYSSNLCVAPETLILTDKGEFPIKDKQDQKVNIWNGWEFSPVVVRKTGEMRPLITVTLSNGKKLESTEKHKWYVYDKDMNVVERHTDTLKKGDQLEAFILPGTDMVQSLRVENISDINRHDDTYCFTEPKRNRGTFNGIVTGQCLEIMEVTKGYREMDELFEEGYMYTITIEDTQGVTRVLQQGDAFTELVNDEKTIIYGGDLQVGKTVTHLVKNETFTISKVIEREQQPETALCSLSGIVLPNVRNDAHYDKAMFYAQHMIDYCINNSDYPFPQIAFTAKQRMNAGVGVLGVATIMARRGVRYDTTEGLAVAQELAQRHLYFAIKNSITHGEEKGNAPWMHKTKWPEGWMPFDDRSMEVDKFCTFKLHYDFDAQRVKLIKNKGMRFSCLIAHMPTESSSKAAGVPNSMYPVRELKMAKSDANNIIEWVAMDSDTLKDAYQSAWTISTEAMLKFYAVWQAYADQGISADTYADRSESIDLSATDLILTTAKAAAYGLKSRYYLNSKTNSSEKEAPRASCGSGGCTL